MCNGHSSPRRLSPKCAPWKADCVVLPSDGNGVHATRLHPWNQPALCVFVSLTRWQRCCCWQTLSCVWSCAQCQPATPSLLQNKSKWSRLCRHSGAVTLCQASVSVLRLLPSQLRRHKENVSLLTSSVCLAACLIAGVCSGEEEYRLSRGYMPPTRLILRCLPPNKQPSLCRAFPWHTHTNLKNTV